MATAEVSVEKIKSICSITRANIMKERQEKENKVLREYIQDRLKKHWWEFWKSPFTMSEERARSEIYDDAFSSEWSWRLSRAHYWGDKTLEACDNLETLCKFSNVNMIRVTSEETALLDLTLKK